MYPFDDFKIPLPFSLNCWKHHKLYLQAQIRRLGANRVIDTGEIRRSLLMTGNSQIDLYTGRLFPAEIADQLFPVLYLNGIHTKADFDEWINSSGNSYRVTEIPEGSKWVLLKTNEPDRFIHIHPAKKSAFSVRLRAAELRTSVAVLIHTYQNPGSQYDIAIINQARNNILGEPPMKSISVSEGTGKIIMLLTE